MRTTKSPIRVMRWAHALAAHCLPDHASRFSRHDFTLAQLFACLVLREVLGLSYRATEAVLLDADWCRQIGMRRVPDHTTLCRAFGHLATKARVNAMLDLTARVPVGRRCVGRTLAVDGTLLETHRVSRHYERRCRDRATGRPGTADARRSRSARRTPKLSVGIDVGTHLILSARSKLGMGSDAPDFHDLLYDAWRRADVRTVLADAGFDSEANHRLARLDLNVESLIRAGCGRPTAKRATGRFRRQMQRQLAGSQKGKAFGQRSQVETVMSMLKRNLGDALRSRSGRRRKMELLLKTIAHNVMILRRDARVATQPDGKSLATIKYVTGTVYKSSDFSIEREYSKLVPTPPFEDFWPISDVSHDCNYRLEYLSGGSGSCFAVFDVQGNQVSPPLGQGLHRGPYVQEARFSPTTNDIWIIADNGLSRWDLSGHSVPIPGFSYLSDLSQIGVTWWMNASASEAVTISEQGEILVRDAKGMELAPRAYLAKPPVHAAFSDNGQYIATTSADGFLNVWERSGRLVASARPTGWRQQKIGRGKGEYAQWTISPDGQHLALAKSDPSDRITVTSIQNFDGGRTIYTSLINGLIGDELATSTEQQKRGYVSIQAFISKENSVAFRDQAGTLLASISDIASPVVCATLNTPASRIVVACRDMSVRFYDTKTARELIAIPAQSSISQLRFTPDGTRLILDFADGTLEIWDTRDYAARQKDRDARFDEIPAAREYVRKLLAADTPAEKLKQSIRDDASITTLRKLVAIEQLDLELARRTAATRQVDSTTRPVVVAVPSTQEGAQP